MIPVPSEDLPIGERLSYPLYDHRGILLLSAGSQVTPRFLEKLRKQHICTVHVPEQVAQAELREEQECAEMCARLFDVHTETTWQLDQMIDDSSCLDFPSTSAPFLSDAMRIVGAELYDKTLSQELIEHETTALTNVSDIMSNIVQIRVSSGQHKVVRSYMNYLKRDLDLVVATTSLPDRVTNIYKHSLQLCILGMGIASKLRFDPHQVFVVGLTGLLHDVGMLKVKRRVRGHRCKLTIADYLDVMKHVILSADLLEDVPGIPNATRLASYQVHERCNSRGYPRRRARRQIHPIARILGVADAYLSYISPIFGRKAMMPYTGMVNLLNQSARGYFDPDVVRALLSLLSLYPIGSNVILNDGRAGKVIRSNGESYDRPVVKIIRGVDGDLVQNDELVDLRNEPGLRVVQAVRQIIA